MSLSNAVGDDIAVTLGTTAAGTATSGDDYNSTLQYESAPGVWSNVTGTTDLPADGSSISVRVAVTDDALTEANETVVLGASSADARLTDSSDTGTGTINEDFGTDNPAVDEDVTATLVVGDATSVEEADGNY